MADQPTLFDDDQKIEELRAELKNAYAEQIRLRDLYMHHSTNNQRREEEIRAHTARSTWWSITRAPTRQIIHRAKAPIDDLAEAVRAHKCEGGLGPLMDALRSIHELADARDPDIDLGPLAEIRWLREYIRRAGARLHVEHAQADVPPYDRCRCVGCELIIGTDLRGEQGNLTAVEARTELEQRLIEAETRQHQAELSDRFNRTRCAELEHQLEFATKSEGEANRAALRRVHQSLQATFYPAQVKGRQRSEGAQMVLDHIAELIESWSSDEQSQP